MAKTEWFNVVLLGNPSSGKTAFLVMLAKDCEHAVFPAEAGETLKNHLHALERKTHLRPTQEQESVTKWRFDLPAGDDDSALSVRTSDYSGELTRQLNDTFDKEGMSASAGKALQNDIHQSHGVLFLVDCHALARSGGWRPWCETNAMALLKFIKDVISDKRRHPILILLTRSDLVEESFLKDVLTDVRRTIQELSLKAKVSEFRAFTSKAGHPAPADASPDLSGDYLAPDGSPQADPKAADLVRDLWRMHKRAPEPWGVGLVLAGLVGLALLVVLLVFFTKEQPVTPKDLRLVIKQMPVDIEDEKEAERIAGRCYVTPSEGDLRPPLSRLFRHWYDQLKPQFKTDDVDLIDTGEDYVRKVTDGVMKLATEIEYRAKESVWRPTEVEQTIRVYEEDLKWMGAADELSGIAKTRKKKLDKLLDALGGLDQDRLERLANEYFRIGEPIPDKLREQITDKVYFKCRDEVAAKLKDYAGAGPTNLKKLYEEELPRIIGDALSVRKELLGEAKRKELEDVKKYLDRLKLTRELEFRFKAFIQDQDKTFIPAIRIAVEPSGDRENPQHRPRYYYPINGTDTNQNKKKGEWPYGTSTEKEYTFRPEAVLKIGWSYGDRINIDVWDVRWIDEHLIEWHSDRLGSDLVDDGYDLPGLTFMVFWDAHAQFTLGKDRSLLFTLGKDRSLLWYRLALKKEGNGYEMLKVPSFLREANKRRTVR